MPYTLDYMRRQFPDDDACLKFIFERKYPEAKGYYKVSGRKCYAHKTTGHQIHPLKGTIFEKSPTKLTTWFFAIYLLTESEKEVSAKELQRQLKVTYKTAWRIKEEITLLIKHDHSIWSLREKEKRGL